MDIKQIQKKLQDASFQDSNQIKSLVNGLYQIANNKTLETKEKRDLLEKIFNEENEITIMIS